MRFTMFVISLLIPSVALATPSLSLDGDCGEAGTFTVDGMTAGGDYYVLWGSDTGSASVPGGSCTGSASGLSDTRMLSTSRSADAAGTDSMSVTIGDAFCGKSVQFMDADTCEGSNVVSISAGSGDPAPDCDWATEVWDGSACVAASSFYDEGYAAGYPIGVALGTPVGLADGESGYEDGTAEGYAAGFVDGVSSVSTDDATTDGYNDGYSTGFFDSYSDAYFDGYDSGYSVADDIAGAECDPPEDGRFWIAADYGTGTDFDASIEYNGDASCWDSCGTYGDTFKPVAARWVCNLHGDEDTEGCTADTDGSYSTDSCTEQQIKSTYIAGSNPMCGGEEDISGFMDKDVTGNEMYTYHSIECLCKEGPVVPLVAADGRHGWYGQDFYVIDLDEGTQTSVGYMDVPVTAMAYDDSGTLFFYEGNGWSSSNFGTMDFLTGVQSYIGESDGYPMTGMTWSDSLGVMLSYSRGDSNLQILDTATGGTDVIGYADYCSRGCITESPDGIIYMLCSNDLYTLDAADGSRDYLGYISDLPSAYHQSCTHHDGVMYSNHGDELHIIDPVGLTAEGTGISLSDGVDALAGAN